LSLWALPAGQRWRQCWLVGNRRPQPVEGVDFSRFDSAEDWRKFVDSADYICIAIALADD